MKKTNRYLIAFICGFIFPITIFLISLNYPKSNSYMFYDENISFKLPFLIKFASLIEREQSYRAYIDKVIDVKDSDKVKIEKIFNSIKDFPTLSELQDSQEGLPHKYKFRNTIQHEYQVLIKQHGQPGEQALNFCNLMAIAGYPASPVYKHTALVIVRSDPENFLYFDFDKKKMIEPEAIWADYRKMCEEKLNELDKSSKNFFGRKYLHGYSQIGWYNFWYIMPWRGSSERKDYLTTEPPPVYLIPQ